MTYQPYLIANYATGLDRELQPWLLVDDAWTDLLDGYVYRGVTSKRDGYSGLANGLRSIYTESRMVHNISPSFAATGLINGINTNYTVQFTPPIIPTSITITGSNPLQVLTDDGAGNFIGAGTGTINYLTGAGSISFTLPPIVASTITATYANFALGNGGANYGPIILTNLPVRRGTVTLTAGAQVVTDDGEGNLEGDGTGTINYTTGEINVIFNAVVPALTLITISYDFHPGLPVMGIMNFYPNDNVRQLIVADTTYVNRYDPITDTLVDITTTLYNGSSQDFWSWVNYPNASSAPRLLFANGVVGDVIQQWNGTIVSNYAPTFSGGTLNARQIFEVRDRLVLFQTIEGGTFFPRRIRISGFGANTDNFDNTAPGAGFIDIPDNTFFFGAAFNRDDILFFTEAATWMMKYTGNDVTPFTLEKVDGSRGSKAAFSVISYLNRTMAASPRGLIRCDGYTVERMDDNIPDFSFDNINNEFFESCFSGFVDEDRDVYLLYPSSGDVRPRLVDPISSDRILVANFEEDNFSIYRTPLSSMGNFQVAFGIQWSDLTAVNGYPNWDALAQDYGNWNSFPFTKGVPVAIGGGHKGEVWKLNDTENEDNPLKIRDIQIIDADTLEVTTDWNNYNKDDYIVFEAVGGMIQLNDKQAPIISTPIPYNVFRVSIKTDGFSAYTGGGKCSKTIPFEAVSKKFNPWINLDKKVRCGWIYFYVSVSDTDLTDGEGNTVPAFIQVDILTDNREGTDFTNPTFKYLIDCSQINNQGGSKKWVKIWINQVGEFLQFRISNNQAGAEIQVHAMMPGFQPIGELV